jgi:hypothetical protein
MKIEQDREGGRYFLAYIGSLNKVTQFGFVTHTTVYVLCRIGLDGYLGLHLQSWLKGSWEQMAVFPLLSIPASNTNTVVWVTKPNWVTLFRDPI